MLRSRGFKRFQDGLIKPIVSFSPETHTVNFDIDEGNSMSPVIPHVHAKSPTNVSPIVQDAIKFIDDMIEQVKPYNIAFSMVPESEYARIGKEKSHELLYELRKDKRDILASHKVYGIEHIGANSTWRIEWERYFNKAFNGLTIYASYVLQDATPSKQQYLTMNFKNIFS